MNQHVVVVQRSVCTTNQIYYKHVSVYYTHVNVFHKENDLKLSSHLSAGHMSDVKDHNLIICSSRMSV